MMNYISPFIMIAIGLWHYARHGIDLVTIIPIVLGCFALYLVLFNHSLQQRVLAYLTKLWFPIGQFITIILFILTFIVIFIPVGTILRLLKKDILDMNFEQKRLSYWIDRPPKESSNYTQQF
jgi:hypothetical protein